MAVPAAKKPAAKKPAAKKPAVKKPVAKKPAAKKPAAKKPAAKKPPAKKPPTKKPVAKKMSGGFFGLGSSKPSTVPRRDLSFAENLTVQRYQERKALADAAESERRVSELEQKRARIAQIEAIKDPRNRSRSFIRAMMNADPDDLSDEDYELVREYVALKHGLNV